MENLSIPISTSPAVSLACTYIPPSSPSKTTTLLIFLNGVDNPSTLWHPTIALLQKTTPAPLPAILFYDRPGQGRSKTRFPPTDIPGRPKGHARDCVHASQDLHALVSFIAESKLKTKVEDLELVLVASSVGVAVSRIYAAMYPGSVVGLLSLDSTLAHVDPVSCFPDPDSASFVLPDGVTAEQCRAARKAIYFYHPCAPNREGLWRGNLPDLLPRAEGPKLPGDVWVTVVGNDQGVSSAEGEKLIGLDRGMSRRFFGPVWGGYNEGLKGIGGRGRVRGPIEAVGAGHLIHKDRPDFVAGEIVELLRRVEGGEVVKSKI